MHNKRIKAHILLWSLWLTITNLGALLTIKVIPWPPVIYNNLSLIAVFYMIYELALRLKINLNDDELEDLDTWGYAKFFLRKLEVIGVIVVLVGYIIVSWYTDHYFMQLGYFTKENIEQNIWLYADGRFARESLFASLGGFYGFFKATILQKNRTIEFQKQMLTISKKEYIKQKITISRLIERLRGLGNSEA